MASGRPGDRVRNIARGDNDKTQGLVFSYHLSVGITVVQDDASPKTFALYTVHIFTQFVLFHFVLLPYVCIFLSVTASNLSASVNLAILNNSWFYLAFIGT